MITLAKFKQLQELFFSKVTESNNPGTLSFMTIKTESTGSFTDFTGDSKRSIDKIWELNCFFVPTNTEKQREKYGVTEDTQLVVFVSPLDLQRKSGSWKFPADIRSSYGKCAIVMHDKHYEVLNIREMEMMLVGKEYMCLAYQISLRTNTGNIDFN